MGYRNAPDEPGRPSSVTPPARRRFRALSREESGQSLVVIVIAMTLIVVIAAFAIDASEWFAKHHQAQVSADSAALAAANCLATQKCTSLATGGDAYNTATTYAAKDGVPASSVTIGGGFVTVTTSTAAPTTFAGVIGLHPNASAHAVASYDQVTVAAGLFAQDCSNPTLAQPINSSTCTVSCTPPGITINTSGNTKFTGAIQTNGSLSISANNNTTLSDMLYGDPASGGPNCGAQTLANYQTGGATAPYGPPQEEPAFATFPDTYNSAVATSNCTAPSSYFGTGTPYTSGPNKGQSLGDSSYVGSSNISIPTGTTVANNVIQGTVTINGSFGATDTPVTICAWGFNVPNNANSVQLTSVTLLALGSAPKITIAGNGFGITPNPSETPDTGQTGPALAIYDSDTVGNALDLSKTNNDNIVGAVYAPASQIIMGGNNAGLSFWEANTISYNGNNVAGGPIETVPGLGSDALVQ